MPLELEVKKNVFSKTKFFIDEKVIRFDDAEIPLGDISGFGYLSTQNRVNGINASRVFELNLWQKDQPKPKTLRFMGSFSGGGANDAYRKIVESIWTYFGNNLLDRLHKQLLAGQMIELTKKVKLTSQGMVVLHKPWFSRPYEALGRWDDLDAKADAGWLWVKSRTEKKAKMTAQLAWKNIWLFYYFIRWILDKPEALKSLMAVPNKYQLLGKNNL